VKSRVHNFRKFEKVYEQESQKSKEAPLRGYSADSIIKRIEEMMEIMPDRVKFGVPADNKGYSLSYRDANGAIQKIMDVEHYYSGKGEEIKFYCWNISYAGSWDATKSLREKIDEFGGFGRELNMNLKKVIAYFSENPEDVDNIRSISISIDSKSVRKDKKDVSDSDYPQPDKEENQEVEDKTEE
jgi:hypothetical protein